MYVSFEDLNFTSEHSCSNCCHEPPCNAFFEAKKYLTPVLTPKGEKAITSRVLVRYSLSSTKTKVLTLS